MTQAWLDRAGQRIRDHVQAPSTGRSHALLRARLVQRVKRSGGRAGASPRRLVLAAAALGLLALLVVLGWPGSDPITFRVGRDLEAGQLGSYVVSSADRQVELRFSEGSVIALQPLARARVQETTPRGAVVLLETGQAKVDIVPRKDARWGIVAGPFTVRVTGTSFDLSWLPERGRFELQMHGGKVEVRGPELVAPVELQGEARFVREIEPRALPPASASAPPNVSTHRVASAGDTAVDEPPAAAPARASSTASCPAGGSQSPAVPSPPVARPSWSELAAEGRYAEVLRRAERKGMHTALQSAGTSDLMALADAARFEGRGGVARRALVTLRRRFAGSAAAARAAFLLGRMADGASPAQAVSWYDRYLAEAPGGALAAEAAGRRMLALRRSGDGEGAMRAARWYLRSYPNGPYAGVAREMTGP